MLAVAAWARGSYGADRRVLLGDAGANWGVRARHFSSVTPVVDFIHALAYVYGAALAGGPFAEGGFRYVVWIEALWRGDVAPVRSGLEARHQVRGAPEDTDHRVKGPETFWSEAGAEAILQLRADLLSEPAPPDDFWTRRQANLTGERRYKAAASVQSMSYTPAPARTRRADWTPGTRHKLVPRREKVPAHRGREP